MKITLSFSLFNDGNYILIYAQVAQEYDVVKNIMQTLNQFKVI